MTEREFQTELIRGLRAHGFHPVPIPDSGAQRFDSKRIYDLGIGGDGVYYGVELKRGGLSLPFDALQPHQRAALQECRSVGHVPLVICVFVHDRKQIGDKPARKGKHTLEAWAVSLQAFEVAERSMSRKSAPLEWWRSVGVELPAIRTDAVNRNGEPAFDARGRRKWSWAWDFRAVHATFSGKESIVA